MAYDYEMERQEISDYNSERLDINQEMFEFLSAQEIDDPDAEKPVVDFDFDSDCMPVEY